MSTASKDPNEALYELAKTVAREVSVNFYGALVVHHPYTGKDGDDRDAWKERLFSERTWDDVQDELKIRHHCHLIIVADVVDHMLCEAISDATDGAVITHRIQNQKEGNVSLYDTDDLARAVTYALSHAKVGDGDSYRYTGRLANHAAGDQTAAQMRAAVRDVAPQTLGLDLHETTCSETGNEHGTHGITTTDGADLLDDDPSEDPGGCLGDNQDQPTRQPGAPCAGRLIPIEHAEAYIDDVDNPSLLRSVLDQHKAT
jgi:hypothetical protein